MPRRERSTPGRASGTANPHRRAIGAEQQASERSSPKRGATAVLTGWVRLAEAPLHHGVWLGSAKRSRTAHTAPEA